MSELLTKSVKLDHENYTLFAKNEVHCRKK